MQNKKNPLLCNKETVSCCQFCLLFPLLEDKMEQMRLYFEGEEFKSIKDIVPRCYKKVRNKYKQVAGESIDDFRNFIVCETLLEVAEELKQIALYRQNLNINARFDRSYDGRD